MQVFNENIHFYQNPAGMSNKTRELRGGRDLPKVCSLYAQVLKEFLGRAIVQQSDSSPCGKE